MKKRFKFLLILSLCLNIFMIGFIAGEIRHFKPRREVSQFIQNFVAEHEEEQHQINKERKKAIKILRDDKFDAEVYAKQVAKVGEMQNAMFQKFAIEMGEKLRSMPKSERDAILDRLKERRNSTHHLRGR